MNGNIIGNRYEIVETIGKGGMAIVYKAKCQMLNRYVALKVLRPEYREDKAFISRFKVEAQSAGSLSHPNVVSIYDVVHDGEQDFIVMEYVEGVTLKQYLEAKGTIPWREAVDYAAQICAGLDHAHKKGIIHKDIKPHNVIITREGTIKITDFGIAKVMSSSTITTGNTTMGSVHYFSPEQARGGYIDYKTDIYSLGVVLYEMVTGKLPFDGDTAIAVAMQHIEKEPVMPTVLNPEIPKSLENVIRRAMSKEQMMRYDSVGQMLVDLKKVYTGNDVQFYDEPKPETESARPENKKEPKEFVIPGIEDKTKKKQKKSGGDRKKDLLGILVGTATGLALVVILFLVGYNFLGKPAVAEIELPSFENMTVEEAENMVVNTKLVIEIEKEEKSNTISPGRIISQSPAAGKMVKENATIKVVISEGESDFPMPDLTGKHKDEAEKILKEKGLIYSFIGEPNEDALEDYVTRQTPEAGIYIDKATSVTVYTSTGKENKTVKVPNLLGLTEEEAKVALLEAGLSVGQVVEANSTKAKGMVISQSIRADIEVKEKTSIDLRVSSGKSATQAPQASPTAPPETEGTKPTEKPGIVIGPPNASA